MKKTVTLLIALVFSAFSFGQDIGVVNISSPVTGCVLSTNETVTIQVFNFGPTVSTNFDVSYVINGGTPVTETIILGSPFLSSSSYTYTFTTQANLSAPGTYTIDAYTTLAGDVNPGNDAFTGYQVNSDALSVGGTVTPGTSSVCSGSNSGTLTLSGYTGTILNWEYSTNGGTSWTNIANTTTTQNYNNLTVTTMYRCAVKSGVCPTVYSAAATLTIDNPSVGGTVSGTATVCSGSNNGTLTLSGHTGNVQNWEFSTDGGTTWTSIANTTVSQNYTNLLVTTWYRAKVKNGSCPTDSSSIAIITTGPATVGGTVSGSDTVCSGSNNGTLTLSGHTGSVLNWEYSINGGTTWISIANTSTVHNYTNLATTTWYRAEVFSCASSAFSSAGIITVAPESLGGTVSGSTTVCGTINSGTLTLSGHIGDVLNWESSTNGGGTWTTINNTTVSENYTNLTTTTLYRSIVKNGSCPTVNSDTATITVDSASAGGMVMGSAAACLGTNSGTLQLTGYTGGILNWEYSTDSGVTWTSIANTTSTQNYTNLLVTTWYRAEVFNCSPSDFSTIGIVTVNQPSVGGSILGSDTACSGSNNGTLQLTGHTGDILNWELSTDEGANWSNLPNNSANYNYVDLTTTALYRAVVKNGGCPVAVSSNAGIIIHPVSVNAGNDTTIEQGSSIVLNGQGGLLYSWTPATGLNNPAISNPSATPSVTTTYTLTATDSNGCTKTDDITIFVNTMEDFASGISNLITLNGDGINDTWNIEGIEFYPSSQVTVFNLYGNAVYSAKPYLNDWNGTYNGSKLPDGTYYYVLKFSEQEKIFKGSITILSGD